MAGSSEGSTWKAVTTLEWKRKQKQPEAASKGVGAILGEAADVVVGKYGSAGAGPGETKSGYLGRLSEIQVQDEAYIHQQLVKPEEVKLKRAPHRLLLKRASKSGRGLKISVSRKVRFNDTDGSPTHTAAVAAAAAGRGSPATGGSQANMHSHDCAVVGSAAPRAGMLAHPAGRTSHGPAAVKAGRHAGGVSFAIQASSSEASTSEGRSSDSPGMALPSSTATDSAAATNAASTAGTAAACGDSGKAPQLPPTQRSPSPAPTQHTSSQQQQRRSSTNSSVEGLRPHPPVTGTTAAGSSSSAGGQRSAPRVSSGSRAHGDASSSSGSTQPVLQENAIMARFLQQPCSIEQALASGLELSSLQLAERQASGAAAGPRQGRRTTDLVDKQLQWLRGSTTSNGSNTQQAAQAAPSNSSSGAADNLACSAPPDDVTLKLGYRPIAIPQELFDRWSTMGSGTKAASAPPAEASTLTPTAAVATAGGPASKQHEGRSATPSRRLSATNVPPVAHVAQHPVHARQHASDSIPVSAATQQHSSSSSKLGRVGPGAPAGPQPGHGHTAPISRRSSGVLQLTSRNAHQGSGAGSSTGSVGPGHP